MGDCFKFPEFARIWVALLPVLTIFPFMALVEVRDNVRSQRHAEEQVSYLALSILYTLC